MTTLVFLDPAHPAGRVADATVPNILVTDQGLTRGDGIFESMLAIDGEPRKIRAHLDRLAVSASTMDLLIPDAGVWQAAITTALTAYAAGAPEDSADHGASNESRQCVVRLIATRGPEGANSPTAWVTVSPVSASLAAQREKGLAVLLLERGYDSDIAARAPWLLMGAKTLSYAVNMAALRHAHHQGADDVIFTSGDGLVLEGPTSSVLLAHVSDDSGVPLKRLITPHLDTGILPGTTQGALFAAAQEAGWELGYGPLTPADLLDADAVWLISSLRLLAPVTTIDGKEIGTAAIRAELTAELSALLATTL
ncbi:MULTISPECIES: aminodeoxychorismate lyase [Arthrobacter]|uniref:Aminodeoxychorismate lyase n=1 Tax=Arthrobacter psychrochitiniphilus TaxID=291045 RepID=A0A2V3DVG8_9MICC|nr:aminodeoxychorismate lyase [Arthrobacter psychrochitiniphilus]NYG15620.1 4-amino-4-deoxychorismate lyase [Arthrobacter psychrochitiniphilus]PXA66894.1 aminodeoxychorismate lyase [Arthrobacter psychrochitiniphilus]